VGVVVEDIDPKTSDRGFFILALAITTIVVVKKPPLPSRSVMVLDYLDREGPTRFLAIQRALDLKPSTLDRALKSLEDEVLVDATMVPEQERRGSFEYSVTRRGKALLRSARAYRRALRKEAKVLGRLADRLDPLSI
jgi:DNA-binding HxlR family transcriptional regulator